jgi:hypothetical protein
VLKDVRSGDIIELETPTRTNTFVVEQIVLVYLDDVFRSAPTVGFVPYFGDVLPVLLRRQRYIVQASATNPDLPHRGVNEQASSERGDAGPEQSTR